MLYKVEAVADVVAIVRAGRLVVVQPVDKLKAQALRRIELTLDGPVPTDLLRDIAGVRELAAEGCVAHLMVEGSTADLLAAAAPHRVSNIVTHEPDLEQIFMAYYSAEGG